MLSGSRALLLILMVAAVLRLFPVWFGLPHPYARPDETVSISRAMDILAGDPNPHFFHWPSLSFYLFAAAFAGVSAVRRLLFMDPALTRETAVITARVVVALAGALTLIPLFRLARRISDDSTALVAAGFLAVAVLHVRESHFAMTDVLMTLLLTASLARLVAAFDAARAAATDRSIPLGGFAVAGMLGGLATSTKYNAAAIPAAMVAAQVLLLIRFKRAPWAVPAWRPSAAFLLAFALAFVAASPFVVLDFATFSTDFRYDLAHLSAGHGIGLGRGWYYHLTRSLPYGCGPLILVAGLAGIVVAGRRHPGHAAIIGAFVIAFYTAIGSGYTVFYRYVLPLVPVVCLAAALATRRAGSWIASRTRLTDAAAVAMLAVLVAAPSLLNSAWMDVLLARTDTRVLAGQWLAPRLHPDHSVHDGGGDYARLDLAAVRYHEWYFNPESASFGHPRGLTPDWLVLSESPLQQYGNSAEPLRRLAREHYEMVFRVSAGEPAPSAVYDQQDAFFLPIAGFRGVERPGPNIEIYRRRE